MIQNVGRGLLGDGQPQMTTSVPRYSVPWDLGKGGLDPRSPACVLPLPTISADCPPYLSPPEPTVPGHRV